MALFHSVNFAKSGAHLSKNLSDKKLIYLELLELLELANWLRPYIS